MTKPMANSGAQLLGGKELEKKFRTLGDKVQRKVLRNAVASGATPIAKATKAKVAKETGTLELSIGKKVKAYPKSGSVVGVIGPRFSVTSMFKGRKRRPAYYAHLAEKGHIAENGKFIPGNRAIEKAAEESQPQALDAISTKLAKGVVKEASA